MLNGGLNFCWHFRCLKLYAAKEHFLKKRVKKGDNFYLKSKGFCCKSYLSKMSLKGRGNGSTDGLFTDSGYYHGDPQSHSTSVDDDVTSLSLSAGSLFSGASGVSSFISNCVYQKSYMIDQ